MAASVYRRPLREFWPSNFAPNKMPASASTRPCERAFAARSVNRFLVVTVISLSFVRSVGADAQREPQCHGLIENSDIFLGDLGPNRKLILVRRENLCL